MELLIRKLRTHARPPARATEGSTGFDLYACLDGSMVLTRAPQKVPTGVAIQFPTGFDAQIRPRSGLSSKGVGVAFGTIDADYRGELLVTMWTFGDLDSYALQDGDRIAQLVFVALASVEVTEVSELSETSRGVGGHGSTGR